MRILMLLILLVTAGNVLAQDSVYFRNLKFDITYATDTSKVYFVEAYNNKRILLQGDSIFLPDVRRKFSVNKVMEVNFLSGGQGWLGALGGFAFGTAVAMTISSNDNSVGHPDLGPLIWGFWGGVGGSIIGGIIGLNYIPRYTSHSLEGYTPSEKKKILKQYLTEYQLDRKWRK